MADILTAPGITISAGSFGVEAGVAYAQGGFTLYPYVYVVDSGNNRVNAYDYNGVFKFSWGTYGSGNGQFSAPYDAKTDGTLVYVSDTGNNRIQIFTMLGVYVGQFGSFGTADGEFNAPMGVAPDDRFIWVVDHNNNRFQVFDKFTYGFFFKLGTYGTGIDQFAGPTDCDVDELYFYIDRDGTGNWLAYPKAFQYGAAIRATIPSIVAEFSVMIQAMVSISATIPMLSASFDISVPQVASISASIPMLDANFDVSLGIMADISASIPMLTAAFSVSTQVTAAISAAIPMLQASFSVSFVVASTGFAIVMNTVNHAVTEYENYNYESIGIFGDDVLGIGTDGNLYRIHGKDDNGVNIDAFVQTGDVDFASGDMQGRFKPKEAWVHYETPAATPAITIGVQGDQGPVYTYPVPPAPAGLPTRKRAEFGKGLNSQSYSFIFQNVNGADFKLLDIEILADPITRRA